VVAEFDAGPTNNVSTEPAPALLEQRIALISVWLAMRDSAHIVVLMGHPSVAEAPFHTSAIRPKECPVGAAQLTAPLLFIVQTTLGTHAHPEDIATTAHRKCACDDELCWSFFPSSNPTRIAD
jgi:hypothetical protein